MWAYALCANSIVAVVVSGANIRLRMLSSGHRFTVATVPRVPVVIVPGAKVGPDGQPMTYLRGRLDIAIELLAAGKADEILISGDAAGTSGDEIACMRTYLLDHGVDPTLIREDGLGLSTRATCERARDLFGIDRAIIVTQPRHAARAIALCRGAGIDADGVDAYCDCKRTTLVRNNIREWLAAPKAVAALLAAPRRPAGEAHRPSR
ncbi:YdcF family protein [Nocardia sp. NEAU-G5]|uniref:YdcF family protein n=2 Tax=Nocardia albiluteola TaxID=2842303 RepID=A0ABS6AUR1_9NOCA|nr:YdcF family protein [Nocardia albiluteola]